MKRTAAALIVGASLGLSLVACSPSTAPAPKPPYATQTAPATPTFSPSQVAAKETLDGFIRQVRAEAEASMEQKKPENEQDAQEQFAQMYSKSLAFVKEGSMTAQEKQVLIATFARPLMADPTAVISAEASSFVEKSPTEVSIKGGKFTVVVRGENVNSGADTNSGGEMVWSKVGTEWKITKFSAK